MEVLEAAWGWPWARAACGSEGVSGEPRAGSEPQHSALPSTCARYSVLGGPWSAAGAADLTLGPGCEGRTCGGRTCALSPPATVRGREEARRRSDWSLVRSQKLGSKKQEAGSGKADLRLTLTSARARGGHEDLGKLRSLCRCVPDSLFSCGRRRAGGRCSLVMLQLARWFQLPSHLSMCLIV